LSNYTRYYSHNITRYITLLEPITVILLDMQASIRIYLKIYRTCIVICKSTTGDRFDFCFNYYK